MNLRAQIDRRSQIALRADLLRQRQCLIRVCPRDRKVTPSKRRPHERLEDRGNAAPITGLLRNREALLEPPLRFFVSAHQRAKLARTKLCATPKRVAVLGP